MAVDSAVMVIDVAKGVEATDQEAFLRSAATGVFLFLLLSIKLIISARILLTDGRYRGCAGNSFLSYELADRPEWKL